MGLFGDALKNKLRKEIEKVEDSDDVSDEVKEKCSDIRDEIDSEDPDMNQILSLSDELEELKD